jgi:DMSO/TMAO reductase YedYZ molybdopterin-dependent catalytic subunit
MNKKTGIILAIIIANIVLIGTAVTLYYTVFKNDDPIIDKTIKITGLVEQEITLNLTDLELLPSINQRYIILGNPNIDANYTGVSLEYLVTVIANITENNLIRVHAIDKLARTFTLDEIQAHPGFIIAYKKDGEYLKPMSEGGNGPFRLIVPSTYNTYNGQFCVKYVNEIEIIAI